MTLCFTAPGPLVRDRAPSSGIIIIIVIITIIIIIISSSSSSRSSQDRLLSPFPAKSCPEDFHATFIHNIQRKGEDTIG